MKENEDFSAYAFSLATDNDDLLDYFLNFPDVDANTSHPLDYAVIAAQQAQDAHLQQKLVAEPQRFVRMQMDHNVHLVCHIHQPIFLTL